MESTGGTEKISPDGLTAARASRPPEIASPRNSGFIYLTYTCNPKYYGYNGSGGR